MNHLNKPELVRSLNVTATSKAVLVKAHKRILVAHVSLIAETAIVASETNYIEVALKKVNALGVESTIATVDTKAGVAQLAELLVHANAVMLEKNELLYLDITKAGTGAFTGIANAEIQVAGV